MSDWGIGPGAGFFAAERALNSERLQTARAFSEFRQQNPTATLDDLQMAVQQIYGPNIWLHGAPRGDMLNSIAAQNEERRRFQQSMQSIELANRQSQMHNTIMDTAQRIARTSPDAATAASSLYSMFGNVPNIQQYLPPQAIASMHAREQALFSGSRENLDLAVRILESGGDLRTHFGDMPAGAISALQAQAQSEMEKRRVNRDREMETQEFEKIRRSAEMGVAYEPPADMSPDLRRRVTSFQSQSFAEARKRLIADAIKEADNDPDVASRIRMGDLIGVQQSLRNRLNQRLGNRGELTDSEFDAAFNAVREKAGTLQRSELEAQRQNALKIGAEQAKSIVEQNQQIIRSSVDGSDGRRLFGSGPHADAARDAIKVLTDNGFFIDPQALIAIGEYVKSGEFKSVLGSTPTSNAAMQAIQRRFASQIRGNAFGSLAADRQRQLLEGQGFFNIEDAGNYVNNTRTRLQSSAASDTERTQRNVAEIVTKYSHDPQAATTALQAQRNLVASAAIRFREEIESRARNSGRWSAHTGRQFSQEDARTLIEEHVRAIEPQLKVIDEAIARIGTGPQQSQRTSGPAPLGAPATPFMDVGGRADAAAQRIQQQQQTRQQEMDQSAAARARAELMANPRFRQLLQLRERAIQAGNRQQAEAADQAIRQMMGQ